MIKGRKYRVYGKSRPTRQTIKHGETLRGDSLTHKSNRRNMKNDKVLRYPLADIGTESPMMTVHLHQTSTGYWQFRVQHNLQIDIADRLFNSLADSAGLEEKVMGLFNSIPRKRRCYPCLWSCSALFCRGEHFPDRESVVNLIENAYLPCWRYAIGRIMENYTPGESWLRAVRETEKQHWSAAGPEEK